MSSIEQLQQTLQQGLIPINSKTAYEEEWRRFTDFLSKHDLTGVSEQGILAYCSSLRESGYAPTTCTSRISMLKKNVLGENVRRP